MHVMHEMKVLVLLVWSLLSCILKNGLNLRLENRTQAYFRSTPNHIGLDDGQDINRASSKNGL